MGVTADGNLCALWDVVFDHGGLLLDDVHDGDDDLIDVLFGQLLSGLESLNHVVDELNRHLVLELGAVVRGIDYHVLEVQALCGRGRILDFNGLEEGVSLDNLVALGHAQLCVGIVGGLLGDELPVAEGLAMLEDGRVGRGAAVVCLDEWLASH